MEYNGTGWKDVGMVIRKALRGSSYIVWLLFGDSIPTRSFIFENVFL